MDWGFRISFLFSSHYKACKKSANLPYSGLEKKILLIFITVSSFVFDFGTDFDKCILISHKMPKSVTVKISVHSYSFFSHTGIMLV